MYHKIVFSFAIIFLLFSCGGNSSKGKLELNDGEKWTIIESMVSTHPRNGKRCYLI